MSDSADRLLARAAILDVLHRYAHLAAEDADLEAMAELWTADGMFVLPDGTAVPPREIARIVGENQPSFIRHHITTVAIDFSDDRTATADSYFIAYTDVAQPDHWGRWRDEFRREPDGRWLLTSKRPVVEGCSPEGLWAKSAWPQED